jgi:peroxiredoxin
MQYLRLAAALALPVLSALASGPLANRRAPGFSLMDVNFNQHDLADYRGKVVVVEFMRTDCPVCLGFSALIGKLKAKYGDRVEVLTIVNTPPDNLQSVTKYISAYNIKNPVLFDRGDVVTSYLKLTPQNTRVALPHVFLVDRKGWIRSNFEYSELTESYFTGDGAPLLEEVGRLVQEAGEGPAAGPRSNQLD